MIALIPAIQVIWGRSNKCAFGGTAVDATGEYLPPSIPKSIPQQHSYLKQYEQAPDIVEGLLFLGQSDKDRKIKSSIRAARRVAVLSNDVFVRTIMPDPMNVVDTYESGIRGARIVEMLSQLQAERFIRNARFNSEVFNIDNWTVGESQGKFGRLCASLRSLSGFARLHGLPPHDYSSEHAYEYQASREHEIRPTIRRFLVSILLVTLGAGVSICGWLSLYDKRRFIGPALIVVGTLLNGSGLVLWWLIGLAGAWSR